MFDRSPLATYSGTAEATADMVGIEDVTVISYRGRAIIVEIDGEHKCLPQSQLGPNTTLGEVGSIGTLEIPVWLAEKEGLV